MKIVIDIPEDQYTTLNAKTQEDVADVVDHGLLIKAIKNGEVVKPNVGVWIPTGEEEEWYGEESKCCLCGCRSIEVGNYCGNCGAKMIEVEV